MTPHVDLRSKRFWAAVLCTTTGLLAPGAVTAVTSATAANALTTGQCQSRVNDTPSKLVACVQEGDLMGHLKAFQDIADANPGPDGHPSRNSGEPGYKASADYVAQVMRDAGYNVTLQKYQFDYYTYIGVPTFSSSTADYVLDVDWGPGRSLGSASSALSLAGGITLPPTTSPSSTSGCTTGDYGPAVTGHVVLVQRGGCNFGVKVLNAQAKGATGVVIFNEGQVGRQDLDVGSLVDANDTPIVPTIPVAFTTFAVGNDLYSQVTSGAAPTVSISIPAIYKPNADDWNVIAESKGGDKNHVLVVDAHLDAIYGAGILDNATGSAAILDVAQMMKNVNPQNKLRFIWFGGEELGLYGSTYYVNNLTSTDANKIGYDLDADVFGTPNYTIGVLDPAAPNLFGGTPQTYPNRVYKPSQMSRDMAVNFFSAAGFNHEFFSPVGTDAYSFNKVGIPAGGLLTGQDCCKTPTQVGLFGGQTGNFEGNLGTFDGGCVDNPFLWCDNISNVDPSNFTLVSKAFADMVVRMAFDTKVMSSSGSSTYKPKLAITGEVGKHFPTS